MIFGVILGVLGLIFTIVFGIYSIKQNKRFQKKVALSFRKKECYSLFREDINRLNIQVHYQEKALDNYLILFKGIITNEGNLDIDNSSVYKPLMIKTQDAFKWLEVNILEKPDGSNIEILKSTPNSIEIKWDLLKSKEKIEFEALVEVLNHEELEGVSEEFYQTIDFDFRITNLNEVDKVQELTYKEKRGKKIWIQSLVFGTFSIIAGLNMTLTPYIEKWTLFSRSFPLETRYEIIELNDTSYVTIRAKSTDLIEVQDINNNKKRVLTLSDFNTRIDHIKISSFDDDKRNLSIVLLGGVYLLMGMLLIILGYDIRRKAKAAHNVYK